MAESHRFSYTGNIPARKFQLPPERVKNQFANDGSFLEMFKKRMEEQMKATDSADGGMNSNTKNPTTTVTSTSNDKIILSACVSSSSSDNLSNIDNTKAIINTTIITPTTTTTTTTTSNPLKSGLLPLVGKRRSDSRRSLKTGIVKKLRTDNSDTADNSSMNASSKYTEEVKRYKATMCVEDEKSRPLVK